MRTLLIALCCVLAIGSAFADVVLPTPDQLVGLTISERLALYRAISTLPAAQRDQKLAALRDEINALTPAQKQDMKDRFETEYKSLAPAQQDQLQQQLKQEGR